MLFTAARKRRSRWCPPGWISGCLYPASGGLLWCRPADIPGRSQGENPLAQSALVSRWTYASDLELRGAGWGGPEAGGEETCAIRLDCWVGELAGDQQVRHTSPSWVFIHQHGRPVIAAAGSTPAIIMHSAAPVGRWASQQRVSRFPAAHPQCLNRVRHPPICPALPAALLPLASPPPVDHSQPAPSLAPLTAKSLGPGMSHPSTKLQAVRRVFSAATAPSNTPAAAPGQPAPGKGALRKLSKASAVLCGLSSVAVSINAASMMFFH